MTKATTAPRMLTEEAVLLAYRTHADHVRSIPAFAPPRGRFRSSGTRLGNHDARDVSRQGCWFRLVSIVEAYVDLMSSDLLREATPGRDALVARLVELAEERSSSNWTERKEAFKNFHGVSIASLAGWEKVDSAIPVRNAVAHGLGSLTPRQRNRKTITKLAKVGVTVTDGRVKISETALTTCRDNCVRLIRSIDKSAT